MLYFGIVALCRKIVSVSAIELFRLSVTSVENKLSVSFSVSFLDQLGDKKQRAGIQIMPLEGEEKQGLLDRSFGEDSGYSFMSC